MKYTNLAMLALTLLFSLPLHGQNLSTDHLTSAYRTNPIGLGAPPMLAWQLKSTQRGVLQTAWQVRAAANETDLAKGKNLLWDSGKVASNQSNHIPWGGKPLGSRQRCYWQVRAWDNNGHESGWSQPAYFEMGLLAAADWKAQWVKPAWPEDTAQSNPSPMLRKQFRLADEVRSARLYATAHGLYEAQLNGQRVGDQYFTPGWTSYHHRLQYQVFDVTGQVKKGDNALAVTLGDGWWRGFIGWAGHRNHYGKDLALLLQLEVVYMNGKTETITSDGSWRGSTGPILASDLYNGEVYDARKEIPGWASPGFNDSPWKTVQVADFGFANLVACEGVPVRKIQEIKPVKVFQTPKGETVFDFGQNMVGWVRLRTNGTAGTTVTLQHAEVLDKHGNFYTENMRSALTRIQYTLKGSGEEAYEPRFTFMGFRYVKIEGLTPGMATPETLTGIVVHSDLAVTGGFECSNPLVNQLQRNIQWGQKGNFLDVPTDCPQRDERMGWTGDAQAFCNTAAFNMDVQAFYTKWLADVAADQGQDGNIPFVVPNVLSPFDPKAKMAGGSTGWADVATILPWNTYLAYGNRQLLERQYESMKAWVRFMENQAGDDYVWDNGFHFGDWLFYSVNDDRDGRSAITDKYFLTQAFFAHSVDLVLRAAGVLGKQEDVDYYSSLHQKVVEAFRREHVTPNGRLSSATQTAYVLALEFDLLPEHLRKQAADRLVENIRRYDNHLTTGFLGTPYINHVLTNFGHTDMAYQLLLQDTWPSWLYPVKMGATTIWERWDGIKPDSSFQEASMNSFNHYAYGAVGDWLYRTVAGILPDAAAPGYQRFWLKPQPGGGLSYANAWHDSPYGRIVSGWEIKNGVLQMKITVPANSVATVVLYHVSPSSVKLDGKPLALGNGVLALGEAGNGLFQIEVGSGTYLIEREW